MPSGQHTAPVGSITRVLQRCSEMSYYGRPNVLRLFYYSASSGGIVLWSFVFRPSLPADNSHIQIVGTPRAPLRAMHAPDVGGDAPDAPCR